MYSDEELHSFSFAANKIYRHKVVRINYTTYDVRRAQDSLNPRNHADFMVLAHENETSDDPQRFQSYWYGRIVGIFHSYIKYNGNPPERMDFLWVRWLGEDPLYHSGFKAKRLPRVGFVPFEDGGAFGFLDPGEIIRAVHLVPAFAHGRTKDLLAPSIARHPKEKDEDWQYFYINM